MSIEQPGAMAGESPEIEDLIDDLNDAWPEIEDKDQVAGAFAEVNPQDESIREWIKDFRAYQLKKDMPIAMIDAQIEQALRALRDKDQIVH